MVDDPLDVRDDVRGEENRLPLVPCHLEGRPQEIAASDDIESEPGIIEHENVRIRRQSQKELGASSLPEAHRTQREVPADLHLRRESLRTFPVPLLEEGAHELKERRE